MREVFAIDLSTVSPTFKAFPTFGALVNVIVRNAFVLAGIICFLLLVFGGFTVIMGAGGDAKKLEQGKETLTGAAAGLLFIVTSYWIIQVIEKISGVKLLSP